ncbi:hypothetical protein BU14_0108s0003, partial [Porphyra umbilicalis]
PSSVRRLIPADWRRCAHRTFGARRLPPPSQHLRRASYTPYFYSFLKCTSFCFGGRCFSCPPSPPSSPAHPRSLLRCSSTCVLLLSLSTVCIWMPFLLFLGRVLRRVDARQARFEFHQ